MYCVLSGAIARRDFRPAVGTKRVRWSISRTLRPTAFSSTPGNASAIAQIALKRQLLASATSIAIAIVNSNLSMRCSLNQSRLAAHVHWRPNLLHIARARHKRFGRAISRATKAV